MKPLDLVGQRFGRLVVTGKLPSKRNGSMWRCLCDCGKITNCAGSNLKAGQTKSCGCLRIDIITTHKATDTSEYYTWCAMKSRCSCKNDPSYKYYGARGIRVCKRWVDSFENFIADMGKRPAGKSIDRINNDGDYEPSNCKWSTQKEQMKNRRKP